MKMCKCPGDLQAVFILNDLFMIFINRILSISKIDIVIFVSTAAWPIPEPPASEVSNCPITPTCVFLFFGKSIEYIFFHSLTSLLWAQSF
jgi:hypothetical protein